MNRALPVLLCTAALLAAPPPVALADGSEPSLLERLAAETAALTAKADAQTAVLTKGVQRLAGVFVGDPARFVVALDDVPEHGDAPADGQLKLADGALLDATLLDADRDLGLAVYAINGPRRAGLALANSAAMKRGSLVVSAGADDLGLHLLGDVGGPLDDLDLPGLRGTAALAPSGGLLGLRPPPVAWRAGPNALYWAPPDPGVAAAETLRASPQVVLRGLADRTNSAVDDVRRLRLEVENLQGWVRRNQFATPRFDPTSHARVRLESGIVPASVIERALADVAREGGRFRRAYLGVVVDEQVNGRYFTLPSADGHFLTHVAPDGSETVWNDELPVIRYYLHGAGGTHRVAANLAFPISTVRLASVLPDSPADKAGLRTGLRIIEMDGRPLAGARGFARALARRRPGEVVTLLVKDRAEPVRVLLADREQEGRDLATTETVGLTVLPLNPSLLAFFELPDNTSGVVVRNVEPGSAAALAGIARGDLLERDGADAPIRDAGELDAFLGSAKGTVLLKGRRGSQMMTFSVTLPDRVSPRKTR